MVLRDVVQVVCDGAPYVERWIVFEPVEQRQQRGGIVDQCRKPRGPRQSRTSALGSQPAYVFAIVFRPAPEHREGTLRVTSNERTDCKLCGEQMRYRAERRHRAREISRAVVLDVIEERPGREAAQCVAVVAVIPRLGSSNDDRKRSAIVVRKKGRQLHRNMADTRLQLEPGQSTHRRGGKFIAIERRPCALDIASQPLDRGPAQTVLERSRHCRPTNAPPGPRSPDRDYP